jgi:hypothetical protein
VRETQAPIGGPSIAPAMASPRPPPAPGPSTNLIRADKSGIIVPPQVPDSGDVATTIGVSIGVGVPILLGAGGLLSPLLLTALCSKS